MQTQTCVRTASEVMRAALDTRGRGVLRITVAEWNALMVMYGERGWKIPAVRRGLELCGHRVEVR